MQRIWLLNWNNITYDKDNTLDILALIDAGIIEWFDVSGSWASAEIEAWKAFIECTRSNGEKIMVAFENTANVAVDMSGTKKVYILVDQTKIDNWSENNEDGTGIASIQTGASYPAGNYVPLYSIASDVVTDDRSWIDIKASFNITKQWNTFNGANQLVQLDGDGLVPQENLPPAELDIDALTEDPGKYGDFGVIYDWSWNKKIKIENIQNALKKYQLSQGLSAWELVQLLNTGKIDKLDLVAFTQIDVINWSFGDGYPNSIFKIDDDHFCVLAWYNSGGTSNWWSTFTYKLDTDGTPVQTQASVLTTSLSSSSSYTWSYMVPMGNNFFVFFYQNNSWYLYATISEFNPTTGAFTHGSYQTVTTDSTDRGRYVSGCRMTDSTLLVQYYGYYMRKITINTSTKAFTTLWSEFTITGAYSNTYGPMPVTSWWADIGAVCYQKSVSGCDIYAQKIVCTWHDLAFSEETVVYDPWSSDVYLKYWVSNIEHGWDGRSMAWVWWYNNNYGRCGVVRYDDTNWFEVSNVVDYWYRHNPDFIHWFDEWKFIVSSYEYDWSSNGRYYYTMTISDLTLARTETVYITSNTYQRKCISVWGGIMYVWNDQSWNKLYLDWKVPDLTAFFGILQEAGATDELKKVARYWNVSQIHTWLTPGKQWGYWVAINSSNILLFKNA